MNEIVVNNTRWGKRFVIVVASCILFLAGPFGGKIGHWSLSGVATVEAASYCAGQPDGTLCDDGKPCTTNDVCASGVCVGGPAKNCDDGNECTDDSCNATTGACVHTNVADNTICEDNDGNFCTGVCASGTCGNGVRPASYCLDDTACTTDTCDPATGCVHTPTPVCMSSTGNNFTMLDSNGNITGGTNDVVFTWDGTCNDSVATAAVNATISSNETFFGNPWRAHDVMIYCEGGPYTVYTGCAAGNPGCGTGANYTFAVGAGQLGGHMLFFWNGNDNIDVVDVWGQGTFSGNLHKGADNGESCAVGPCDGAKNGSAKAWDLASTNWDVDVKGIPGAGMKDGPFGGFNGNFNLMKTVTDKCAGIDCSLTASAGQCKASACDPATGQCVYTAINEGLACNDNSACTSGDACVSGACTGTATNCDDANACTTDSCNKTTGVCSHTAKTCNDSNVCTTDSCNTATGSCVFTPVADGAACTQPIFGGGCMIGTSCISGVCGTPKNCSDGNACTVDSCSFGTCGHTAVTCTDNPPCLIASCDAATGSCLFTLKDCGDNNACTDDTCEAATGACVNANLVIDDNNACTADSCDAVTGVAHTPITCDDGNACTADSCDPATGCVTTAIDINDNNACTTDACEPATGAVTHTTVVCNDNNACTADSCDSAIGCISTAINCNDSNACTADSCDPSTGCVNTTIDINDNNACTTDACDPATGIITHTSIGCDDSNACTRDTCDAATGACIHTPITCNDNNACTIDSCSPVTGCVHATISCDDSNACTTDSCNPSAGCVNTTVSCDDNNACTTESCNPATGCVNTAISCDDSNACTTDSCNPSTGCVNTAISCNDSNACTSDSCNSATGCVHTVISCDDNNACTTDACNPTTGCVNTSISCIDNNTCTTDSCDPASGCKYAPVADGSTCTVNVQAGTCTAGVCNPTAVCPAGSVKSVKIRGGGQKPGTVDLQIQTEFTVVNGGCIVDSSASTVTVTPGTILQFNCKAGIGPEPTSGTWQGNPLTTDSSHLIVCPSSTGEAGKLILDNKAAGGKDADRMTVMVQ